MNKHLVSIDDFDAIDRLELFSLVEILKGHQSDFRYRLKGKILTNLFYESGFSTTLKFDWDYQAMTDDHYMCPQSVTKFIMDSEFLLEDFDHFLDCFMMCRKTHYVKKSENELLSKLTKKTRVLTRDRYKHLGFNLYKGGLEHHIMETPELLVPTYFTDWELNYQSNGFRATIIPNENGSLEGLFQ